MKMKLMLKYVPVFMLLGSMAAYGSEKKLNVKTEPVQQRAFEDSLMVQGNIEAVNYALVPARMGGTVEEIWAAEGDEVKEGDNLARTDPVKLEQAVAIRERELEVAQCGRREKEAALQQCSAQLEKAQIDYDRYKILLEKEVVTQDEFERRESTWKQQTALCDHSKALLDLASAQEKLAAVALEMAKKDLQDSFVVAPIDGVVSERMRELGEMAAPGTPVFRMVDKDVVEISAYIPSEYYEVFVPGQTKVRLTVHGKDAGEFPVTYRSPEVDNRLRTFEIKARLENANGMLAPGDMAEVEGIMASHSALGVPRKCVVRRGDRDVVFVVENGRVHQIPVETGFVTDGWIEVRSYDLKDGMLVVTAGQTMLNDGDSVEY